MLCICVCACMCACVSHQFCSPPQLRDCGGVNVACQRTGVMEGRMSDNLISFCWWVVVNRGVCVCVCVVLGGGGVCGAHLLEAPLKERWVYGEDSLLLFTCLRVLPAWSFIRLSLKFLHLSVTDDIILPSPQDFTFCYSSSRGTER